MNCRIGKIYSIVGSGWYWGIEEYGVFIEPDFTVTQLSLVDRKKIYDRLIKHGKSGNNILGFHVDENTFWKI